MPHPLAPSPENGKVFSGEGEVTACELSHSPSPASRFLMQEKGPGDEAYPSVPHTSNFRVTRLITSSVKSLVLALPPRSDVATPS